MKVTIDISNKTIIRILSITLLFVIGVMLVAEVAQALLLIFTAFFLAVALSPAVNSLAKRMPWQSRGLATATVFIAVIGIISVLAASLMPPLVRQTNQLIDQTPQYIENVREEDGPLAGFVERYEIADQGDEIVDEVVEGVTGAGEPIINFVSRISTSVVAVLTVLVLTFFMLIEGPRWVRRFWSVQTGPHVDRRKRLVEKMYRVVTGFVNGQLLIAAINAIAIAVILLIMGIPFALSLAAIVGILGLIPIIGATLGAVIVVVAGLFDSLLTAIILAVYFIIYQQIENNVIQPAIQSKSLGMSPLLILVSVLIGLNLAGILGGLVAIPIAGSIQALIQDVIEHRKSDND